MTTKCAGMNCQSTDGTNHSPECRAEHAAAVAGGRFVKLPRGASHVPQTYAGFAAVHVNETGHTPSEQEAFDAGVRAGMARPEAAVGEPVAWLHIIAWPGKRACWASISEDDTPDDLRGWEKRNLSYRVDKPLYTASPAARSTVGSLKKGDMREIDGVIWHCTEPDIERWVSIGPAASGQKRENDK